ncbi:hypothetical protein I4U23_012977 [Adineta vaga]|nr:hypothetical protein I4U23_012977 [Adineta vaga]
MDKDDHLYYLNIANERTFSSIIFCFKHLKELYIRKTNFPDGRIPREIERLAPTLINLGIFDTIINVLPEQIGKLKNLRTLELVRTYLRILPESIGDLTNLIYICLSYNSLEILPRPIINIVSLRQIDLSNNPFLHSIEQLNDHPFLRVIQANNCSIEKLPINLPKLTDLYMANNKLKDLLEVHLVRIQRYCIKFRHNYEKNEQEKIVAFRGSIVGEEDSLRESLSSDHTHHKNEDEICRLFPFQVTSPSWDSPFTAWEKNKNGNIKRLKIVNEIYVPSTIFYLQYLEELVIQNTTFEESLHQAPKINKRLAPLLTKLTIRNVPITHLPEVIGELRFLRSLKITNTDLETLPDFIGKLSSLTKLSLQDNKLSSIPSTIKKLDSLDTLDLRNNKQLRSIHNLNGHSNLKVLHADNCSIEFIPNHLPKLKDLQMGTNQLTDIFGIETLGSETNEKKNFFFSDNLIRYLTPFIRRVNNLVELNLNGNLLYSLPKDIYDITTMKDLYIKNNYMKDEDLKEIVMMFMEKNITKVYYEDQKYSLQGPRTFLC